MRFKYENSLPDEGIVHRGVRQGAVTSARIFCLYFDEIVCEIYEQIFRSISGTGIVNFHVSADDLVLFCPTASRMKHLLATLQRCL